MSRNLSSGSPGRSRRRGPRGGSRRSHPGRRPPRNRRDGRDRRDRQVRGKRPRSGPSPGRKGTGRPGRRKPPQRSIGGKKGHSGPGFPRRPRDQPHGDPSQAKERAALPDPGAATTWVFGPARLRETVEAIPGQVRRVLLRTGRLETRHQALLKTALARGVPVQRVPNRALDRLAAGVRHQGAAAEITPIRWHSLGEVIAWQPPPDLLLLLDGIEDPRNFGALARTADGAGVGAVLVPGRRAAPPSAAAMAASAGTLAQVKLARFRGTATALQVLGAAGYRRAGLTPRVQTPWHAFDWTEPAVLVVGSEGRGLGAGAARECDVLLSLPQLGSGRSLNVSVAAGIVLYEALRQRGARPPNVPRGGSAADPFRNRS